MSEMEPLCLGKGNPAPGSYRRPARNPLISGLAGWFGARNLVGGPMDAINGSSPYCGIWNSPPRSASAFLTQMLAQGIPT